MYGKDKVESTKAKVGTIELINGFGNSANTKNSAIIR